MPAHTPRLLDVLDAFEDGIYIINHDYTVEYMNKSMKELFGDGMGKRCHEVLIGSDNPCAWCRYNEVFVNNETHHSEVYIESVDKIFALSELPITNQDSTTSKLSIYRDISRRVQQEARLESSKASYQRLFTHAGCGVFISSKQGRFLDVNPTLLKMLGYQDKEEFLSLDLAKDVYLSPEDRREYTQIIEKKGQVVDYEVKWRRRDGKILHILMTSTVRYDYNGDILGYEGIVVDQTRRKKHENDIKEAHNFLDKIISCSPNAIMAMDMQGVIKLWNKSAEDIFGVMAAQVVEKMNIQQIFSKKVANNVMEMMRDEKFGGRGRLNSYPLNFEKDNGELVEGNLSASILYDKDGNEQASVGLFVDLKERLQTERELGEARQHLLQSEKLAAMGRLTSQIAHELNNPLFGIMNTLELMKTEISPQNKRRKLLDMSLSEIERLADMLKKMLSFSKPDQDKRLEIDINVVIDELMMLYEKRFRENSIKVSMDLVESPGMILASRDQLRQVFINMFSNAMYAMPDGGNLEISTMVFLQKLFIIIKDTGTGIKPVHMKKIFDSFFTTKKDSVQGVGLGLSVCYGFIKDHGGDIIVDSKEGEWTKFTITLPIPGK
ncbi:MAG: PAS domain S-box protein [Desulfobacula sp.]|jgi:two-component system NtrC family sensor kinase|uniref:PAS domain-containing sensor histidine kinase n=1 Tax=Desulfobacula sp. TaxID=2593537 RepID=UPI001DD77BE4|nr:PAS domain S-box protein [Desulfobacula sp.]MBT3486540.1 PAS domain S-box protein [Desulfobacula sp.]MBT3805312.1 PAS domain S-box protein [Desulfobacula sp.]MBT4025664.1 PAS domain S-box protein [Desulfobacula sp.]MBT4197523.1 PAS domain S-box protein [Desulfobacula sp.]